MYDTFEDYTFEDYTFGNLMDYVAMRTGQEPVDEYQAEAFERFKRGPMEKTDVEEYIESTKKELANIPIRLDDHTANQLCILRQYDEKFFDIIKSDIQNAYTWIEGVLKDTLPNWKAKYPLMDIHVIQFTEDAEWQKFIQYNELNHLALPTSIVSILTICLRFRKDTKNDRFRKEIEFLDIICMTDDDSIDRSYYLHPSYSLN